MKPSFLLMEVIISIVLLFGVVFSMFQIKENNFSLFERITNNDIYNSAIAMVALDQKDENNQNNTVYLKDVIDTNEEVLRQKFEDTRVQVKDAVTDERVMVLQNQSVEVQIVERQLSLNNQFEKKLYSIRFNQ